MEDYAFYYVRSFHEYDRFCSRFHFFSLDFSQEDFTSLLKSKKSCLTVEILQKNYLGFIVVKPLPQTIIGRTCLKTYPSENKRFYPLNRLYLVNLYGIKLFLDSIAFQEQDRVVSACASSAMWSAFQISGINFQHTIPSPVAITQSATQFYPFKNRYFPNEGLTTEQMAQGIRHVGLEPVCIDYVNKDILCAAVYAYLSAKIPLILGVHLINVTTKAKLGEGHAITITGYSLSKGTKDFMGHPFLTTSSQIKKLYVHDDQIGPFARMDLLTDNLLSTSWKDIKTSPPSDVVALPRIILIPLYHKIRIPYPVILNTFLLFDGLLRDLGAFSSEPLPEIEWDIFLSTIADFQEDLYGSENLDGDYREELLTDSYPRFIWRVIGRKGADSIEFIFDATDIIKGNILQKVIIYSKYLGETLQAFAKDIDLTDISSHLVRTILTELKDIKLP